MISDQKYKSVKAFVFDNDSWFSKEVEFIKIAARHQSHLFRGGTGIKKEICILMTEYVKQFPIQSCDLHMSSVMRKPVHMRKQRRRSASR